MRQYVEEVGVQCMVNCGQPVDADVYLRAPGGPGLQHHPQPPAIVPGNRANNGNIVNRANNGDEAAMPMGLMARIVR
jgi:hypothetical protein